MNCSKLETALSAVLPDAVYHLDAPDYFERYIVWSEAGYHTLRADNSIAEKVPIVNIYVYSQDEDDTLLDDVVSKLEAGGFPFSDPEQAYDEEQCTLGWNIECEVLPDG